jgi:hypothetical protein
MFASRVRDVYSFRDTPLKEAAPQQSFGGDVAVFDEFRLDPSSLRALIGLVATP